MWRNSLIVFLMMLVTAGAGAVDATQAQSEAPAGSPTVVLQAWASGFDRPVDIVSTGVAGDGRLFIVERDGVIRIIDDSGSVLPTPFLDIQVPVDSSGSEEGLLGLTFHPEYATNGRFYVNYTHTAIDGIRRTRIVAYTVSADPDVADAASADILLTVVQPFENHNAGDLAFGPGGYLYIPLGDGGSGGDPQNNAQTMTTLLGKLVRIDVDAGLGTAPDCIGLGSGNYTVPGTNPLADGPGGTCDEIWASGLRNPWRFSFDRATNEMWIADVGQASWEEINFQPAASSGGENYGWRCYEGDGNPYNTSGCGPIGSYTMPVYDYARGGSPFRCAVTGGFRYRGSQYPGLVGHYLFADYCSREMFSLSQPAGAVEGSWNYLDLGVQVPSNPSTFGEDSTGELYVAGLNNGVIYQVTDASPTVVSLGTVTTTAAHLPVSPTILGLVSGLLTLLTLTALHNRSSVAAHLDPAHNR